MTRSSRLAPLLRVLALCAAGLAPGRSAAAAELTVFVSGGSPGQEWGRGYGAIMTITLLNLVHGELEAAHQGGERVDTSMLTGSAKAYVGPTFGRLVPYVGLGAGVYHEGLPGNDDQGTLGSFFIGAKLKVPLGVVLRAEHQWLDLPAAAPTPLERRFFLGAGLSF